jgi:hypothetical protein
MQAAKPGSGFNLAPPQRLQDPGIGNAYGFNCHTADDR